jgi:hypothetical protein
VKATSSSSTSVVFLVRLLMPGRLSSADDPGRVEEHFGVHHVEKPLCTRAADEDEPGIVQRASLGVVRAGE